MSAFPGLASETSNGGIGFNYRLSMGVPDLWIKTLKEKTDEDWDLGHLFHELTARRPEEKTISYAESHDQALVGDKTLIFRLIDKDMYDHMSVEDGSLTVSRGIALHKMIRLLTAATNSGGYLNFMGNEFGHPEWIDFPREGNNWSYKYARRQWNLVDSEELKYQWLNAFDKEIVSLVRTLADTTYHYVSIDEDRNLLSFVRGDYLFVFNFSPETSYTDHKIATFDGAYTIILSSDDPAYGGFDRVDTSLTYTAVNSGALLYIPSRTVLVLKKGL
jgi:1,4-alpha-glucan branching enzyme